MRDDFVGPDAADERSSGFQALAGGDDEGAVRRARARAADFDTTERLAADVFEEALEETGRHCVGEIGAGPERGDEATLAEAGDDEAVLGSERDVGREHAPALAGEVALDEGEANLKRLIGERGLVAACEFAIDRRPEGLLLVRGGSAPQTPRQSSTRGSTSPPRARSV